MLPDQERKLTFLVWQISALVSADICVIFYYMILFIYYMVILYYMIYDYIYYMIIYTIWLYILYYMYIYKYIYYMYYMAAIGHCGRRQWCRPLPSAMTVGNGVDHRQTFTSIDILLKKHTSIFFFKSKNHFKTILKTHFKCF